MASSPFTIEFSSFDGGLAQAPFTGGENQYARGSYVDYWTEPGTLTGTPDLTEIQKTSSASYKATLLDVRATSDASKTYVALVADNASYTLTTAQLGLDGALTELGRFSTYTLPLTYIGRNLTPLVEYASDLFTLNGNNIIQHTDYASSASYVVVSPGNGAPSDIVENFGYLYASMVTTSNASPGYVWRYDASTSSLITTGSPNPILSPAVQLAIGWSPICMVNYGDYIAIAANQATTVDAYAWSTKTNSRLYIWDGISNTFDKKVDANGISITALHTHLGQLYAFASSIGGIDIYRYAGGDVIQKVARIPVNSGVSNEGRDELIIPWVRKQSISSHGNKIYLGIMHDGSTGYLGKLYSFDSITGVVDMIHTSGGYKGINTVFYNNDMNTFAYQVGSNSSLGYNMAAYPFATGSFNITTTTRFAPSGKKMRINRVLVRHNYFQTTSETLQVSMTYNISQAPRGTGATQVINFTGSSLNTPGTGTSAAYEHQYTYQQTDGTPMPLVDSFALWVSVVADTTVGGRPRIFLPIVVEGELIDSPN